MINSVIASLFLLHLELSYLLLMRQPLPIGSVLGNRTPDSAVRGLRLNLLTNTPYSLIIYAVQRKIYYTEEPPSCPVLFLFFSKLFLGVNCKSNFTELNACEPRTENSEIGGPGAGTVRSSFPAKPYSFVPGSKFFTQLPAGMRGFAGCPAGRFAPPSPLSLMSSFRGANSSHNFRPESAISPAAWPTDLLPVPR